MAIKDLSTSWKGDLKTRAFPTERIYIDFRQEVYPPYAGELVRGNILEGILVGETITGSVTTAT